MSLSYFVITFESFDTEAFTRALREFDPNGVVVVWNYSGTVRVAHAPTGLGLRERRRFFTPGTWTENRWVKWLSYFAVMTCVMWDVFSKTSAKRFFLGGGDVVLWIAQLFKLAGRIEKMITTCEDWSMPQRATDFYDWFNREKFLFNDWLMSKMDVTVIVFTRQIHEMRNRYWKGLTEKNSVLMENKWASLLEAKRPLPTARPGSYIALLGTMRRNFGLEILFDILPELNRERGIRLKVIGVESPLYREFKSKCDASGASQFIEWRGFVDNEDLTDELNDCFCGYDMQEHEVNNSKWIVPGRIVNYLQNLLVPTISHHSGVIVDFLAERKMGVVCAPNAEAIKLAIFQAHDGYTTYARNIEDFLISNPYRLKVTELLRL